MRASLRLVIFSLFFLIVGRAAASTPLINLVDENAALVLYMQDVPALLKNWEQSPWARTWNDEQMKKFLAPLRAQMKVDSWDEQCKSESGYTIAELLEMAKGQALVALTRADFPLDKAKLDPADIPIIIALEIGDNTSKVAKIIDANDEKEHATVRIEEFSGVPIHVYFKEEDKGGGEEFTWAMVDGIWLLSPSKATLQASIDALQKGGAASSLGQSERYLQIRKQSGDANLTFIVNMQSLYPAIQKAVEAYGANSGSQPLGMPPGVILAALGIDAIKDFYFGVNMNAEVTECMGGLTYSEMRGILKLLAYRDGPVAQPSFVSAKWITVTSARYSLMDAYTAIRGLMDGLSPAIGGFVQGKIKELNTQLGVDLERDLLGSLGEDFLVVNAMRPGATADAPSPITEFDQLYAFSLQNAVSFTKAVDALKGMMGPQADKLFEKREYLNQTIYTWAATATNPKPGQKGFSYSITPKFLFISAGTPAVIETALQGLDGKQPTLWQQAEVKEALAAVPSKACNFQFQNTRAMIGSLVETLVQIAPLLASNTKGGSGAEDENGENSDKPESYFDLSAKPDAATLAKYWSTSSGYAWRESSGLYFHTKLNHGK